MFVSCVSNTVLVWHLPENVPLPTVNLVNDNLAVEGVFPKLGKNDCPNYPVDAASGNDAKTNNAMEIVRQCLVDAVAIAGRDEGCNDKVDIAEREEDGNRECSPDRGVPVVLLFMKVKPCKARCNKDVDDSKWV